MGVIKALLVAVASCWDLGNTMMCAHRIASSVDSGEDS